MAGCQIDQILCRPFFSPSFHVWDQSNETTKALKYRFLPNEEAIQVYFTSVTKGSSLFYRIIIRVLPPH